MMGFLKSKNGDSSDGEDSKEKGADIRRDDFFNFVSRF
jgi:hypothetical protein